MAFSRSRKLANVGKAIDSGVSGDFLGLDDSGGIFKDIQWDNITGKPTVLDSAATIAIIDSAYVQARQTDVGIDSGQITNLVDSAYVQLRVGDIGLDSAAATGIVDSAYVAARVTAGLDSAATLSLVDSDYVSARASASSGFEYFKYIATAGQTVFDSTDEYGNTLSYGTDNILVFYNGVLMLPTYDYTTSGGDTVTLNEGADSGIPVTIGKWAVGSSSSSAITFSWGGDRGVFVGGFTTTYSDIIDYVDITSAGNATDFGDLTTTARYICEGGASNQTRGLRFGGTGGSPVNHLDVIDYVTIASPGNATDFGNMTTPRQFGTGFGDGTYGLCAGGGQITAGQPKVDVIDYVTIDTTGNAADFGDLSGASEGCVSVNDATRGVIALSYTGGVNVNTLEYVTMASTGNTTDFGDLSVIHSAGGGTSDATRGVFGGGWNGSARTDAIDYITIQTTGNGNDFGDLTVARNTNPVAVSNGTTGLFGGGNTGSVSNVIDSITIQTTGDATDFGDLTVARFGSGGFSGSPS